MRGPAPPGMMGGPMGGPDPRMMGPGGPMGPGPGPNMNMGPGMYGGPGGNDMMGPNGPMSSPVNNSMNSPMGKSAFFSFEIIHADYKCIHNHRDTKPRTYIFHESFNGTLMHLRFFKITYI